VPRGFASFMAMLVAQSPCSRFFGRSRMMSPAVTVTPPSRAATASVTERRMAAESSAGVTARLYREAPRALRRVVRGADAFIGEDGGMRPFAATFAASVL